MDESTKRKVAALRKLHYPTPKEQEYIRERIGAEGLKAALVGRTPTISKYAETLPVLFEYDRAMSEETGGDSGMGYKEKVTSQSPRQAAFKAFLGVVADAHKAGVQYTPDELLKGYQAIKQQIIGDSAALRQPVSAAAIEARTPIIENDQERMAAYVKALGMPNNLDYITRKLLTDDVTENVYRLATDYINNPHLMGKSRKALSSAEVSQLEDQTLTALGVPDAVALALGTVLQSKYSQFVKDIQQSLFWRSLVKGTI